MEHKHISLWKNIKHKSLEADLSFCCYRGKKVHNKIPTHSVVWFRWCWICVHVFIFCFLLLSHYQSLCNMYEKLCVLRSLYSKHRTNRKINTRKKTFLNIQCYATMFTIILCVTSWYKIRFICIHLVKGFSRYFVFLCFLFTLFPAYSRVEIILI